MEAPNFIYYPLISYFFGDLRGTLFPHWFGAWTIFALVYSGKISQVEGYEQKWMEMNKKWRRHE